VLFPIEGSKLKVVWLFAVRANMVPISISNFGGKGNAEKFQKDTENHRFFSEKPLKLK
jgi:hypothetical protein